MYTQQKGRCEVGVIQTYSLISGWDEKFDILAARGAYLAFMSKHCFPQWQGTVFWPGKSKESRKAEKLQEANLLFARRKGWPPGQPWSVFCFVSASSASYYLHLYQVFVSFHFWHFRLRLCSRRKQVRSRRNLNRIKSSTVSNSDNASKGQLTAK